MALSLGVALAGNAVAQEVARAAADAEAAVAAGDAAAAWAAFDRAAELFWAEAPMSFRSAVLVAGVDGAGRYRTADGAYAAGATLTAYLEPVGYGWTPAGDEYRVRLTVDLAIADEAGQALAETARLVTLEQFAALRTREFSAAIDVALPDLPPGNYRLDLTLHDAATGKSATAELPFRIVP